MKAIPKLLNTQMVAAVIDGRKTQTRMPVKNVLGETVRFRPAMDKRTFITSRGQSFKSPFGAPGDLLYVRETALYWYKQTEGDKPCSEIDSVAAFKVDGYRLDHYESWTPSIHMPRKFSRITLKVKRVWVERLQDITRSGIRSEGLVCPEKLRTDDRGFNYRAWYPKAWRDLWDSIYAKPRTKNGPCYPWAKNPWVWCCEFEPIFKNVDEVLKGDHHGKETKRL